MTLPYYVKKIQENNPDIDIESLYDDKLSKQENIETFRKHHAIGNAKPDTPSVQRKEKVANYSWEYNSILQDLEREVDRLRIKAADLIPKMYGLLVHGMEFSPLGAARKIQYDLKALWSTDTIREYLPEEAKDSQKRLAARISHVNRQKKSAGAAPAGQLLLPEEVQALVKLEPITKKQELEAEEPKMKFPPLYSELEQFLNGLEKEWKELASPVRQWETKSRNKVNYEKGYAQALADMEVRLRGILDRARQAPKSAALTTREAGEIGIRLLKQVSSRDHTAEAS